MRILLVIPKYNLSTKRDYNYNFPLGLGYISSSIKKEGKYLLDCLNLNHYDGTIEELITKALNKEKYDLVCTGGNVLMQASLKKIILEVRNNKNSPKIVLGGPIITSEPELMFELLSPDFAVMGEGEKIILNLLKAINKKSNLNNVKGLVYKDNAGKIIITKEEEQIKDIEKIPFPDFDGLGFKKKLDHSHCNDSWTSQCFDHPRVYPILGSRGCPFNCTFCWHDMKFRPRSVEDIFKELDHAVKKYDINYIELYDDCFSANKQRLTDFCNKIKKLSKSLNRKLKWSCQLIVNSVDESTLRLMKDSGCDSISYGFESFSLDVLRSMRKPITPQQIDSALKTTLKNNIGIQGNFIFGDIAETINTAKETLDYWKSSLYAQQISLGFVQPYPGSELYKHCLNKNIIDDKKDYLKNKMGPDTRLNMTKKMCNEDIQKLNLILLSLFRKYFNFITPTNLNKTSKNIYEFDFKCPFCKKTTHYKNCFIANKLTYGFHIICRNCHMRSVLVGPIKKLAYKHYTKTRKIRNAYIKLKKSLKQNRI